MTGYELIYSLDLIWRYIIALLVSARPVKMDELKLPFPRAGVAVFADFSTVDYHSVKVPGDFRGERLVLIIAWLSMAVELARPHRPDGFFARLVLEENYHSRRYRVQFWRNHGRVGTFPSGKRPGLG